jgi:SAM-dependent methyltransferase
VTTNVSSSAGTLISRDFCPWCGSGTARTLVDYRYADEPLLSEFGEILGSAAPDGHFVVRECPCGLLFQRDVLNTDDHAGMYESWQYTETSLDFILFYLQELLMVRAHFARPAGELTILDYGMGWGKFCDVARALDFDTWGYEINEEMRAFARGRGIAVIDDLSSVESGKFDYINLEQVLEHVPEPARLVTDLARLLAPRGILKISVPHRSRNLEQRLRTLPETPRERLYSRFMEIWPLAHINAFSRRSLRWAVTPDLRPRRLHLTSLILPIFAGNGLRHAFRVVARPLYKNYHPRSNYIHFEKT